MELRTFIVLFKERKSWDSPGAWVWVGIYDAHCGKGYSTFFVIFPFSFFLSHFG